jgi:hypothetical protein
LALRKSFNVNDLIFQTVEDGLNTPETWTTIMTKATDNLLATSYVDPTELATLGITGVTTANTGDTGGNPLDIFKGYQQSECPSAEHRVWRIMCL